MREFPACALVYCYCRRWQAEDGLWARLNQALMRRHPQWTAPSRQPSPSVTTLGAQSINYSERGGPAKALVATKTYRGRKHQLVVDAGGHLLAAHGNDRGCCRSLRPDPKT